MMVETLDTWGEQDIFTAEPGAPSWLELIPMMMVVMVMGMMVSMVED